MQEYCVILGSRNWEILKIGPISWELINPFQNDSFVLEATAIWD